MKDQYVTRAGYLSTGSGVAATIDAANEALTCDVTDLRNVTIHMVQITDAGTVTGQLYYSLDGTNYAVLGAAISEASFPAGANTAVERTLSDANGMPIRAAKVKFICSALATGTYGLVVGGAQVDGNG